jgi:signal transduction histidine kinase
MNKIGGLHVSRMGSVLGTVATWSYSYFQTRRSRQLQNKIRDLNLRLSKALNSLRVQDEAISVVVHELKTPLTSLKSHLELMQFQVRKSGTSSLDPNRFEKFLESCHEQIDRFTRTVNELIDLRAAKLDQLSLDPKRLDLRDVIITVVQRLEPQLTHAKCSVLIDVEGPVVGSWDGFRLDQVLSNLISNSVKYAPGRPIQIRIRKLNKKAHIEISDEGKGISRANHKKIFEPFERASPSKGIQGLGLGLYIVKKIIEAHEGSIQVKSQVGKGTRFTIELPLDCQKEPVLNK